MTTRHVHPVGDVIQHDTSSDEATCVCGPETHPVPLDDGGMGWLIVHASLDGRDARERSHP